MKINLIGVTRLIDPSGGSDLDDICGQAAAICTGSTNVSKSLLTAIDANHDSVLEFADFIFKIEGISRVTLAQFTRHRMASFEVKGQRYNRVAENATVVIPPSIYADRSARDIFKETADHAINTYLALVEVKKIKPEDARYILPEGMTCDLMVKMNTRELRHFFKLRQCRRAQWEIRTMADRMAEICRKYAPVTFENSGPGCVRRHCPEGKLCCHSPRIDLMKKDVDELDL